MRGASCSARVDAAVRVESDEDAWPAAVAESHASLAPRRGFHPELRRAARQADRAHGEVRWEDTAAAVELWRGLVEGRWSLVDRFETCGRRYLVARRNPDGRDPRPLSPREREVIRYVGMGQGNKLVAYTLGLSTSSVATHLAAAMRKLGLRTRAELVATVGTLGAAAP